jgi:hypothetical protein
MTLFSSRKFWIGTLTIAATLGAVFLRATGKLPADALVPTIGAITSVGLSVIGSIAWEDSASKGAGGSAAPPLPASAETAVQVNVAQPLAHADTDPPPVAK